MLESVVDSAAFQELISSTKVKGDCTVKKITRKANLRNRARRFTSHEDKLIQAGKINNGEIDFVALGAKLNRTSDALRRRAELLERTGGVKKRIN